MQCGERCTNIHHIHDSDDEDQRKDDAQCDGMRFLVKHVASPPFILHFVCDLDNSRSNNYPLSSLQQSLQFLENNTP